MLGEIMTTEEGKDTEGKGAVNRGHEQSQTDVGKKEVESQRVGELEELAGKEEWK